MIKSKLNIKAQPLKLFQFLLHHANTKTVDSIYKLEHTPLNEHLPLVAVVNLLRRPVGKFSDYPKFCIDCIKSDSCQIYF